MVVLLPLLMAEILIGQEIHEWLGALMLALFLAHHLLNPGWWKSFVKGKYTTSRAFGTALDLLLLADMIVLFVSGIMMSGFVFRFLHISGGMMLARQLHLFASHWGLILMSAHLGMHIGQFFPLFRKMFHLSEKSAARTWGLRMVAIVLSVYGLYAFITRHMTDYLFLQTHFVLFDEMKAAAVYFAETVAMMCLFAAAAYTINKLLHHIGQKSKKEQSNGKVNKAVAFLVPALVCVLVVAGLNLPSQKEPWQANLAEPPEESSTSTVQNTTSSSAPDQPDHTEASSKPGPSDQQIVPVEAALC